MKLRLSLLSYGLLLSASMLVALPCTAQSVAGHLRTMYCSSFTMGSMMRPQTSFSVGKVEWGTLEKQAIVDRINECVAKGEIADSRKLLSNLDYSLSPEVIGPVDRKRADAEAADIKAEAERQKSLVDAERKAKEDRIQALQDAERNAFQRRQMEETERSAKQQHEAIIKGVDDKIEQLRQMNASYLDTPEKQKAEADLRADIDLRLKNMDAISSRQLQGRFMAASVRAERPLTPEEQEESRRDVERQIAEMGQKKQREKDDTQNLVIAEQIFVEKHCPMLQPDEEVIESINQSPDQPHVMLPSRMSASDRSRGDKWLTQLETQNRADSGLKPGSPLDIRSKCALIASAFADTLHVYRYVRQ